MHSIINGIRKSFNVEHEIDVVFAYDSKLFIKLRHDKVTRVMGIYATTDKTHATNFVVYDADKTIQPVELDLNVSATRVISFQIVKGLYINKEEGYIYLEPTTWNSHTFADTDDVAVEYKVNQRSIPVAVSREGIQSVNEAMVYGHVYTSGANLNLIDGTNNDAVGTLASKNHTSALVTNYIPLHVSVNGCGDFRKFTGNSFVLEKVLVGWTKAGAADNDLTSLNVMSEKVYSGTNYRPQIMSVIYTDTTFVHTSLNTEVTDPPAPAIVIEKGKIYFATVWGAIPGGAATDWFDLKIYGRARG